MRYSLEEIETFLTVMELGTVTAAAARLNLSKSVVSKRVSEFEGNLGVALFRRNAGRILPTEAAERLALRLRPALQELQAATESTSWSIEGVEVLRGDLAIAAPMSFGTLHLSAMLARFAAQHPELKLRLDYDDRTRDLAREGFDLGIRIGQSPGEALMSRKLCEDRYVTCASPDLLARLPQINQPQDLNGQPVIGYSHVSNAELWAFRHEGQLIQPAVVEKMSVNNGEAMRTMAEAGLGLAMLPAFIAMPALATGALQEVLSHCATRPLPILAVWPPVTPMPAKLRALIDHLRRETEAGPPWLTL